MGLALEKLPDWPLALTRDEALAFTGVGEGVLKAWERAHKVRFVPRGPHGQLIAPRAQLEAALAELFRRGGSGAEEDMDFGDD